MGEKHPVLRRGVPDRQMAGDKILKLPPGSVGRWVSMKSQKVFRTLRKG